MSKMDDLRAMREARYAANQARAAKTTKPAGAAGTAGTAKAAPARSKPASAARPPVAPEPVAAADALCGHRNMSGRTCTREQGHAAKSHRYS